MPELYRRSHQPHKDDRLGDVPGSCWDKPRERGKSIEKLQYWVAVDRSTERRGMWRRADFALHFSIFRTYKCEICLRLHLLYLHVTRRTPLNCQRSIVVAIGALNMSRTSVSKTAMTLEQIHLVPERITALQHLL